jgi:hypothetical protein
MTSAGAMAATIESAVMPGPVIAGHADLEAACSNCHTRFDRGAQPGLCLDCHKEVRSDVKEGAGYHGRLKESLRECRKCHTEHKGRQARIVALDEKTFDHRQTDFALLGKHKAQACANCHRPKVRYSQAPSECAACHRKDDKHRGGLGAKCGECHNAETWKEARFDHAKTKFPLRRAHADAKVACESCHVDHKFANTPQECAACHREDDMKKGHKGQFGARCEKCHDEGSWKASTFRHDRDTRFALLDRHRPVKCESCHRAPLFREKTSMRCVSCHQADDVHKNSLGDKCEKCHSARGWKGTAFNHDADTKFALQGKHKAARCDSCHRDKGMHERVPVQCNACHERDDREKGHKGNYGEKCETCHNAAAFKPSTFDHARETPFAIDGKHARLACATCHKTQLYRTRTEATCYACHKDQDVHFATYGLECAACHIAADWRKIKPDAPSPDKVGAGSKQPPAAVRTAP